MSFLFFTPTSPRLRPGQWAGQALVYAVLLFLGSGGAMLCLLTALSLPGERDTILWACAAGAAALGCLCALPQRWPLMTTVAVGAVVELQYHQVLALGFRRTAYHISEVFSQYYSDLVPVFSETARDAADLSAVTPFLAVSGVLLCTLLALGVLALRQPLLGLAFVLPVVSVTLFIIPLPPSPLALAMVLTFCLGSFLTRSLLQGWAGRRWAAGVLAVLFAALVGVNALFPQENYTRSPWSEALKSTVTGWGLSLAQALSLEEFLVLPGGGNLGLPTVWYYDPEEVALSEAGPSTPQNATVLQVRSSLAGTLYLRGFSLSVYDGGNWSSPGRNDLTLQQEQLVATGARLDALSPGLDVHVLNISSVSDLSQLEYTTYYPTSSPTDSGGIQRLYFTAFPLEPEEVSQLRWTAQALALGGSGVLVTQADLALPDARLGETLRDLALAGGVDPWESDPAVVAGQVADYIRGAAVYDRNTPATPEGEDFVLHFLQESRQGYCMHFATAAALTLRALGIPARYVAGFASRVTEGDVNKWVTVPDSQAHAWVEYYVEELGWLPLEVTPGYGGPAAADPSGDSDPEDTPPPEERESPDTPAPTQSPEEDPAPSGDPGEDEDEVRPGSWSLPGWWPWLLLPLGLILAWAALVLRRHLAAGRRRRAFAQTDPNRGAIAAWLYLEKLAALGGETTQDLEDLAGKAKFSQHTLTEEERGALVEAAQAQARQVDAALKPLRRLWARYGLALL